MDAPIPEIDNCCEKERFAFFGLAVYSAQVMEHGALNLAAVLRLPQVNLVSEELFDEFFESLSRRTFGQLLKAAKDVISLSPDQEIILNDALDLRNMLIHRYFSERYEDFVSVSGKNEMKRELQGIIAKFVEADNLIEEIYLPIWKRFGVTEEMVRIEVERIHEKAAMRDANS